jgi:hopanoid biosynthesis associated RND transporter like protein HpnN
MTTGQLNLGGRLLVRWVALVQRAAFWILLLALAASAGGLVYAVGHIGINTSTEDMLSEDLPFRQNDRAMDEAFPQLEQTILVVVEAGSAEQAEAAAAALAAGIAARPERFRSVFYPDGEAFFRQNGLLYLDTEELLALSDRLARAQPLLAALKADTSLRGLAEVLELAVEDLEGEAARGVTPALEAMAETVEDLAAGGSAQLSWQALLSEGKTRPEELRRLLTVEPVLDFGTLQPAAPAIREIRALAEALDADEAAGVRIRITGSSVMLQDELKSVRDGIGLVGLLSLVLVAVLLALGLRSLPLVLATLVTLIMGLIWTGFFAAAAIGELNLISVAFAVLFIGLSVDFGIHFALRVEEEMAAGKQIDAALAGAASGVGGALTLTAVAAAIGFFSFLPTTYRGLSELGLISGAGMFIALFANLTVLPALLRLMPPAPGQRRAAISLGVRAQEWIVGHAGRVALVALALGLLAAAALPFARFDDDPLNLRDPESDSVATLLALLDDPRIEPYDINILTPDLESAATLAERLEQLPEVARAASLRDLVPTEQDEKLAIIEETAYFLTPLFMAGSPVSPPDAEARRAAVERVKRALETMAGGPAAVEAARLARALGGLDTSPEILAALERALLGTLPGRLDALEQALGAGPVALENLPEDLVGRYLAADGRSVVDVYPVEDLRDPARRRAFVDAVVRVAPEATGAPVIITAAGRAVVEAFLQAAGLAVLLITLLLFAMLRDVRDSLLVLAPLVLAALLTVAASVVLGRPFNFANVIVLPLLFGLGVASGIHMVSRHRAGHGAGHGAGGRVEILHTNTPRAVLFSALTTIGSFCALALSKHRGTASMGELLTIAIGLSMLTSLIVLPALLALASRAKSRPPEA